jgi:hypothetical protein
MQFHCGWLWAYFQRNICVILNQIFSAGALFINIVSVKKQGFFNVVKQMINWKVNEWLMSQEQDAAKFSQEAWLIGKFTMIDRTTGRQTTSWKIVASCSAFIWQT